MDEILKQEMQKELTTRILPYWMERMVDQENGGFYGHITGQEELMPRADKGHSECAYFMDLFCCLSSAG